jgi:hypothetical protein
VSHQSCFLFHVFQAELANVEATALRVLLRIRREVPRLNHVLAKLDRIDILHFRYFIVLAMIILRIRTQRTPSMQHTLSLSPSEISLRFCCRVRPFWFGEANFSTAIWFFSTGATNRSAVTHSSSRLLTKC